MADVDLSIGGQTAGLDRALGGSLAMISRFSKNAGALLTSPGVLGVAAIAGLAGAGVLVANNFKKAQIEAEKFSQTLQTTGNTTGFTEESLKEMAKVIGDIAEVQDEVIIKTQGVLAKFELVSGDTFKQATLAAQDMSAALGTDASTAAKILGEALNDPERKTRGLVSAGIALTNQQQEQIKVLAQNGDILGAQALIMEQVDKQVGGMAARMNEATGPIGTLAVRFDDLAETLGSYLSPIIESVFYPAIEGTIGAMNILIDIFGGAKDAGEEQANSLSNFLAPAFEFVAGVVVNTLTIMETVWENFGDVVDLTIASATLTLVSFVNDTVHFFTVQIPEALAYWSNNWRAILTDAFNFTTTVFQNLSDNIYNFVTAVTGFFTSGEFDFEWKALTEGLPEATREAFALTQREITGIEAELQADVNRLGAKVGTAYAENLAKNSQLFNKLAKDEEDLAAITPDDDPYGQKLRERLEIDKNRTKELEKQEEFEASFVSLADLNKRISASAATGSAAGAAAGAGIVGPFRSQRIAQLDETKKVNEDQLTVLKEIRDKEPPAGRFS